MNPPKNLLLTICLLLITTFAFAEYVEIGTGTSNTPYIPIAGSYDYSWSQVIYLQSEIISKINIDKISYNVSNTPSNYVTPNQKIYMKHTGLTEFPDGAYDDPAAAGFTLVFDGTVTWNGSGWHEIVLDNAFSYNGTDNLIIYWQNRDGDGSYGYPRFYYTNLSNMCKYKRNNNSFPATSGYCSGFASNIRLDYIPIPGVPYVASDPDPENSAVDIVINTGISWTNGAYTDSTEILLDTENPPVNSVYNGVAVDTLTNAQMGGELDTGTLYYWRVITKSDSMQTIGSVWSFSTETAPIDTYPYAENFETFTKASNATGYGIYWSTDPANTTSLFRWNVNTGYTPTGSTGPNTDYTTGTSSGKYLFTE
ncbi:MAG: hypothetical protein KAW88_10175, partial [Candidatus Cloacimonetes bacterium]|nr:hypothetical protein [Candidatus Cloacimonadota bacterium]